MGAGGACDRPKDGDGKAKQTSCRVSRGMMYGVDEEVNGARRRRPCFAARRTYIRDEALIQEAAGKRDVSERRELARSRQKGRMGRLVGRTDAFFVLGGGGEKPGGAVKGECGDDDR